MTCVDCGVGDSLVKSEQDSRSVLHNLHCRFYSLLSLACCIHFVPVRRTCELLLIELCCCSSLAQRALAKAKELAMDPNGDLHATVVRLIVVASIISFLCAFVSVVVVVSLFQGQDQTHRFVVETRAFVV